MELYYLDRPIDIIEGEKIIWLPRQDQLQEMFIHDQQFKYLELITIMKFNGFIFQDNNYLHYKTLEQIWLLFVMYNKYNKTWNKQSETWQIV